jgi:hypothetical protein
MSHTPAHPSLNLAVSLRFEGAKHGEKTPETVLYAFDSTGKFVTHGEIMDSRGTLTLPVSLANQTVRIFAGPPVRHEPTPSIATLQRQNAYEVRQRLGVASQELPITVYSPIWRDWFVCPCFVSGQLVTTLTLPNGMTQTLPVCNSQVNICVVRPWFWILQTLPDSILFRLRDEVIGLATNPPLPSPGPVETNAAASFALATAPARAAAPPFARPVSSTQGAPASSQTRAATRALPLFDDAARVQIATLQSAQTANDLRARFLPLQPLLIDWFCWWDWLEPFWLLSVECIETVTTDSNGNFFAIVWYPCDGPAPNLYFSADQLQGATWVPVYQPWVRCSTYWNYSCGSQIVLNVTDPAAMACAPPQGVNPPDENNWVLVTAVGGSFVWGTYPAPPAPAGWVQPDGLTNYGGLVNAPFGGYLGMRSGASLGIPGASGITYYRWSYRALGTTAWAYMTDTVVRHYVNQPPVGLPSFPVESMGPFTVAGVQALFTFRPANPPPPAASDPPGTITYWPTDDLFADIYSGYFNTTGLPGGAAAAAGVYQIKLEIFDSAANLIDPSAATFAFIVPQSVAADGTITARAADPSELDGGGFVFNLHIDNNPCSANVDPPSISGIGIVNVCGFLGYDSTMSPVAIDFEATHPNGFAVFDFSMIRGTTDVGTPDVAAWAEVAATSAGSYAGDGVGDFSASFTVGTLLSASCVNAAFAEQLYVAAKATTGWGDRISAYDASYTRAFALAANS